MARGMCMVSKGGVGEAQWAREVERLDPWDALREGGSPGQSRAGLGPWFSRHAELREEARRSGGSGCASAGIPLRSGDVAGQGLHRDVVLGLLEERPGAAGAGRRRRLRWRPGCPGPTGRCAAGRRPSRPRPRPSCSRSSKRKEPAVLVPERVGVHRAAGLREGDGHEISWTPGRRGPAPRRRPLAGLDLLLPQSAPALKRSATSP